MPVRKNTTTVMHVDNLARLIIQCKPNRKDTCGYQSHLIFIFSNGCVMSRNDFCLLHAATSKHIHMEYVWLCIPSPSLLYINTLQITLRIGQTSRKFRLPQSIFKFFFVTYRPWRSCRCEHHNQTSKGSTWPPDRFPDMYIDKMSRTGIDYAKCVGQKSMHIVPRDERKLFNKL